MVGVAVRVYDYGSAAFTEIVIPNIIADTGLGIAYTEGHVDELAVVYDTEGVVYRITSDDEARTWSTPVAITTGTNPAIKYSPEDRREMLCYIHDAVVYVRCKVGTAAYGAAIEVCSCANGDTAVVTRIKDSRSNTWVVFLSTADGIHRYASSNNGLAWALAE